MLKWFNMHKLEKVISFLFGTLFFLVPLVLWPYTSEVFEFNKIIVTYVVTALITCIWVVRMISEKRIVFRPSLLDIPLLFFLGTQLISTFFSIDVRTSIFGYYSRFNGGLLSTFCYCLLFWAYVSNMNKKSAIKSFKMLIFSAVLVSIYGILERFGVDKNIWIQDVVNRVFSTLGQPNWLAAFLAALIPITFMGFVKKPYSYVLSLLFFITLLFTKSRSGILGFVIADLTYWSYVFYKFKRQYLKEFLIFNSIFLIIFFLIKTPFTTQPIVVTNAPALETGGTESGTIRKIVWKGAINLWKNNPLIGTGPETFAYAYYLERPVEHNLVSEWDFIYNKAHNEYLNIAANTGSLGLVSYLTLIGFSIFIFVNFLKQNRNENPPSKSYFITLSLFAGYISLLVSNFFGFSVVLIQLQLFLFPAVAIVLKIGENQKTENKEGKFSYLIFIPLTLTLLILISIYRYWWADLLYAKAKNLNRNDDPIGGQSYITKAIIVSPNEAIYHLELAESYTKIALVIDKSKDKINLDENVAKAISESIRAQELSPNNVNIKRIVFSNFIRLSLIDPKYLIEAASTLEETVKMAPTDAKLFYNLGLVYARLGQIYARLGQIDPALENIKKAVELKPNYKDARLAYAFLLIDKKENQKAKEQLEYILKFVDPNDTITKQQLEEIK